MAKTKEKENKAVDNEAFKAWMNFVKLCKLLFGLGDKSPYNINEIKEDSEFYKHAVELSKELEINWDNMSHEESNRLMLALLDDYYQSIQVDKESDYVLTISIKKKDASGE